MQGVRIYEIPDGKMVSSVTAMFGEEAFDAFDAWMQKQPRSVFPRDFLMWDAEKQGFRWLFMYEEGMEVPEPMQIVDFKGGLYAVAADIDQQTDKPALDKAVQAFLENSGLVMDESRPQMGNIITPPSAREILGYEQMDYYYPVKRK